MSADAQRYWEEKASAVTFTHPLDPSWLAELPKRARILDYGCGYGRTVRELVQLGWARTVGVDFSRAMVARGKAADPVLDLRQVQSARLDEPDGAFDGVILFAVLTAIPDDGEQRAVIDELRRLLRAGGLVYLSDYLLQTDARNLARYEAGLRRHGVYGVWDRDDGGVFRHHTRARLEELLEGFDTVAERAVATTTFSGAPATAIQLLARRR
ncbi:MAG TPA: class I SAM-dependent methyltransferase [Caulobacteraceae bacterium]|nr:class I SAM-dependent methyltransferase [Caulobacteraceae bacterium]